MICFQSTADRLNISLIYTGVSDGTLLRRLNSRFVQHSLTMTETGELYKFSYLWKGCDWLMGFKECVDVRRTVEDAWLKASGEEMFEQKLIGSLGDGIDYFRLDLNDFFIQKNIYILPDNNHWNPLIENKTVFLAEYKSPGFCMLKYVTGPIFSEEVYFANSEFQVYFSSSKFLKKCMELIPSNSYSEGPVVVINGKRKTIALPVFGWPPIAMEWLTRDRARSWPSPETVQKIVKDGCQCVATGHPSSDTKDHEWQLSFSAAECALVHSMDHATFTLYQIMRILIHERLNDFDGCGDLISSYMIKYLIFWVCEDKIPNLISAGNLKQSIQICLTHLEEWVRKGYIPHYFIPERNLIETQMSPLQKAKVLERLITIRGELLTELLSCPSFEIVKNDVSANPPIPVDGIDITSDVLKARCEYAFFKCVGVGYLSAIRWSRTQRYLQNVEDVVVSDTLRDIQRDALKQIYYRVASAAGRVVYRILQIPHANRRRYLLLRLAETFLKVGCASDVTSGKLALASFYFCTGKIRKCILVTDALLQTILPFTVYLRDFRQMSDNSNRQKLYQSVISSDSLPLSTKMKRGCVIDIELFGSTSLWPDAIDLEMKIYGPKPRLIIVPALVYLHFLRFLSFEGINNSEMKMEALTNLAAIAYDDEHNNGSFLTYNIIGICHQRIGNFSEAIEMFCESAKAAKTCDWMNENMNPGLLRIGFILNKKFRPKKESVDSYSL